MITTKAHGTLDYVMGVALIVAPWLFGFARGGAETVLPVALGVGILIQSLLTNYELGLLGLIPMKFHLRMDVILGVFLATSPWIFGFLGTVWLPHVIVGLLIAVSGLATAAVPAKPAVIRPDDDHAHAGHR
jgi:hypothetical protein